MSTDPALDQLSREELVQRARALGARRPEVMTRIELRDEIVRLSEPDPTARRRSRGWLGVARDLVASVMDAGLNMPGAAAAIRGDARPAAEETTGPPPVATFTLAEIYLAQGHTERALATLEEVLTAEPEHAAALALRDRIATGQAGAPRRRPAPPSEPSSVEPEAPAPAPFFAARESEPVAAPFFATREPEVAPVVEAAPVVEPALAVTSVRAECALVASGGSLEGLYSVPSGTRGLVLRVAWFVPGRDGPAQGTRDVPLDPARARVALPPVEPSAHVRAAVGLDVAGAFRPLAVAWVYRLEAGELKVAFAPPGTESPSLRAEVQALATG